MKIRNIANRKINVIVVVSVMLIAVLYSIGGAASSINTNPSISVMPDELTVRSNDIFTVDITVDPSGTAVYAGQYDLIFNPDILEVTSQHSGEFLSPDGANTFVPCNKYNNTLGIVSYAETRLGAGGVTDPGILASITFHVKEGQQESNTSLDLTDVILSDTNGLEISGVIINNGIVVIVVNLPPVADFSFYVGPDNMLDVNEDVLFDASSSYDPDGTIVSYSWDFGDGGTGSGVTAYHAYEHIGDYTVVLTATDNEGATSTIQETLNVKLIGDINEDGIVNILDAALIGLNFGDQG